MLELESTSPPPANDVGERFDEATVAAWRKEHEEWTSIRDELATKNDSVTACAVTLEQRKRMLARGERPMRFPWRGG